VINYILYFIQVDKKITTKQSKNMNTINSITELTGKITICVICLTVVLFFWIVIVALFALIDFVLSCNVIEIKQA
jgi:hypothetical protein